MTRTFAVIGSLLVLAIIVGVLTRVWEPSVVATSTIDPDVRIECTGGIGQRECGAWGDSIIVDGSPTTTFEAEDLVRIRLGRDLLGLGSTCHAEWFLGRYPEDVAWSRVVDCPDP